ncbi:uncharacterized protein [Venturia canescens]|uniref:uncharacterized protein n=1 Tax=Venturia canescens TaxID=32260 RepID=UPI001C9CD4DA|nr:uncharacterized protein LOC122406161 [Venturia canescens]
MARGQKYGNESIDVLRKGCLDHYDSVACSRISVLVLIGGMTLVFVLLKIVKYHAYKHSRMHHYLIFYFSATQCILCIFNSIFGTRHPQLDFATYYLKLLHFIVVCHFFSSSAAKNRHRDDIIQHVVNPILGLYTLYLTAVILMGMVDITSTWTQCFRPYWLMLSGADFTAVQLFASVALYLTYDSKRSAISALVLPTIRFETRDIWLIVFAFEVSAFVSIFFDGLMIFIGKEETGCSGIYNHVQIYYSLFIIIITVLKYLLPTWMLLAVFQPIRVKSRPSEVGLTSHYNLDRFCENQYRRILFSPNLGTSTLSNHPTIPYSNDSPLYGSFGDFSYTDSLSDISPTIANRWSLDEDCDLVDKRSGGFEQSNDANNGKFTVSQYQSYHEKTIKLPDDKNNITNAQTSCDLSTINEESHSVTGSS